MPKSDQHQPLPSDAQLEVLNIIWDHGEATVGQVWQDVAARRPVARNTVLTLISRLEEKGWLQRRSHGSVLRYRASIPKETALRQIVRRLVDTAFRGSAEGLVMTLLGGDLSEGEAERIQALLDKSRSKRRSKP